MQWTRGEAGWQVLVESGGRGLFVVVAVVQWCSVSGGQFLGLLRREGAAI